MKHHRISRPGFGQRSRKRRHPADTVEIEIHLVEAHDAHDALDAGGVGIPHSCAKEHVGGGAAASRDFRIHDFGGVDSPCQEADPAIDLAQPPLAVLIVGVLAAIAVARGPGHHLRHRPAFTHEQEPQLVLQPLEASRRDVVLDTRERRMRGFLGGFVVLTTVVFGVRFLREGLAHVSPVIQPRLEGPSVRTFTSGGR
jgi:hypothetical protein